MCVLIRVAPCITMKVLREVSCKACDNVGLTAYAQCQKCGIRHKVEVIL